MKPFNKIDKKKIKIKLKGFTSKFMTLDTQGGNISVLLWDKSAEAYAKLYCVCGCDC